jgi:hypothetical protein
LIRGNPELQGQFAQLTVPSTRLVGDEASAEVGNGVGMVYVIDGLLDLMFGLRSSTDFNLRQAACGCIKSYFYAHTDIRLHFLARAIDGHKSGRDEVSNVLTILLHPSTQLSNTDPYALWFAAVIMFHLLYDNEVAKANAMAVSEGDIANGEEVVTSIQSITSHLITGLSRGDDSRILTGYLMLLLGWLYEDLEAVDDFLGEASHVQSLIHAIIHPAGSEEMVQGLCAMLLGVIYEFSTKDSPVPRETLHTLLVTRLGRNKYLEKLAKLRSHPFMRDFEVIPQRLDPLSTVKLADVYFDDTFVEFFKDNYSRLVRAIDQDPDLEIPVVVNGTERGVSRELVDSLRKEAEEKQVVIEKLNTTLESTKADLDGEKKARELAAAVASAELSRLQREHENLQHAHGEELRYVLCRTLRSPGSPWSAVCNGLSETKLACPSSNTDEFQKTSSTAGSKG